MPKVAIIQRVLTKYRMPFYQKLKQRLESDRIDLEFIHGLGDGLINRLVIWIVCRGPRLFGRNILR